MKITNVAGATVALTTLAAGDAFKDSAGNIYLKANLGNTFAADPTKGYATNLATGNLDSMSKDVQVIPINAEVHVH